MGLSNEQVEELTYKCSSLKHILGDVLFTSILIDFMAFSDRANQIMPEQGNMFEDGNFIQSAFAIYTAGYIAGICKDDQNRH